LNYFLSKYCSEWITSGSGGIGKGKVELEPEQRFSGSAAFSVLVARSPEGGPIYVLDEYPHDLAEARKLDVKTFARGHYKALIKMPLRYEQPQRTVAMYLGQDSWAERGDTHTLQP
jgi:hypothetical protein